MKNKIVNYFIYSIYLIIGIEIVLKFIKNLNSESLISPSIYINYEGGFIRRGIVGSLLLYLSKNTNINPFKFQEITTLISLLIILFLLLYSFYRLHLSSYIIISSFFIGNILAYNVLFDNTDSLLIVYGILNFFIINKYKNLKDIWLFLIVNVLLVIGTSFHEAYFLFSIFPILFICFSSKGRFKIFKLVYILPAFIFFLAMGLYYNGQFVDEQIIIDSWKNFSNYPKKIEKLYWTFNTTDEFIIWKIKIFKNNPIYLLGYFLNTILIFISFLIYLNYNFNIKRNVITKILFLEYLIIIALSAIAVDYIRWFWMANIFVFFFLILTNKTSREYIDNKKIIIYNNCNKIFILFLGLPLGGSWSPTQYLYTMPITHLYAFLLRIYTFIPNSLT